MSLLRHRPLLLGLLCVALPAAAEDKNKAQSTFETKCSVCHGKAGKPVPMFAKIGTRDLSDPEWHKARTDAQIKQVISGGSKGTVMRAFKEELKPEEIDGLVGYIRTLKIKEEPAK